MRILRALHQLKKCLHHVRVDVSIASGMEAASGHPLRLLLAGNSRKSAYLLNSAFRDTPETTLRRRVSIWDLKAALRDPAADCDFSIVSLPHFFSRFLSPSSHFVLPNWVNGSVTLLPTGDVPRNRSLDSDLRLIKKYRLEPKLSQDRGDFDEFYHRMHVPLIRHSHGSLALIASYESLRKKLRSCELLLVLKDGQPIAGGMIDRSVTPHKLLVLGVSQPIDKHLRCGASAAVYHYAFKHFARQGQRVVDIGAVQPLLDDGVLQFKKKWGLRLRGHQSDCCLLEALRWSPATAAFFERSPFIHQTSQGLCGAVFLGANAPVDDAWLERTRKAYLLNGLENLTLFRPYDEDDTAFEETDPPTTFAGQRWRCRRL
jgi:hypothetical protein